jgi:hypothetical protein
MDWANWSTARKILLPASLLLLIDSFLNWQQVDLGVVSAGQSMWHGLGFLIGILLIVLIAWEALDAFAPDTLRGMNLPGGLLALGLAGAILILTVIRVLTLDFRHWPAWVGLILALVIGYGGWLRFKESGDAMPSRATMGGGGASASSPPAATPPPPPAGGMGESGAMGGPGAPGGSEPGGMGGSEGGREDPPPA